MAQTRITHDSWATYSYRWEGQLTLSGCCWNCLFIFKCTTWSCYTGFCSLLFSAQWPTIGFESSLGKNTPASYLRQKEKQHVTIKHLFLLQRRKTWHGDSSNSYFFKTDGNGSPDLQATPGAQRSIQQLSVKLGMAKFHPVWPIMPLPLHLHCDQTLWSG